MNRDDCLDCAFILNDAAGQMMLRGRYDEAAPLLRRAAFWSPSEEGRKALNDRADEAEAMAAVEELPGVHS